MNLRGKSKFTATSIGCNFKYKLRLAFLENFILAASEKNAEENGFGVADLKKQNLAWVLSRLSIKMTDYPSAEENFYIETWIENVTPFFTTRNFRITNSKNEEIGGACSIWFLLNLKTRLPNSLKELPNFTDDFVEGTLSIVGRPKKIRPNKGISISRHRVKYSDIDFNGHTNSVKYAEWIMDLLPLESYYDKKVKFINMNYLKEVGYGEQVEIFREDKDENNFCFEIRHKEIVIFRAEIELEDN